MFKVLQKKKAWDEISVTVRKSKWTNILDIDEISG